jgi:N4-gp56 family major capsid protein
MADFHATQTDNTSVGDSILSLWNEQTLFEAGYELVTDQFATVRQSPAGGRTVYFPRFALLSPTTTALTDSEDLASSEITDTAVSITCEEFGRVATYNIMAELQSGRVNLAVTKVIGSDMGASLDKIALAKLEAFSTTVIYPNSATAASNLATTDVLDKAFAGRLYNKLVRKNVPGVVNGMYAGIAHDDNLFDLRNEVGSGSWVEVNQYSNLTPILQGEVGMFNGIRWFRSRNVTVTADSNGTIDSYKVNVLGANALGKAVTKEAGIVISGPFDPLLRFHNVGWYGILGYAVVDTNNMVQGICASSVGSN